MSIRERLVSLLSGAFESVVAFDFTVDDTNIVVKRSGQRYNEMSWFFTAYANGKPVMLPDGSQLWSASFADDVLGQAANFHTTYGDKALGVVLRKAAGRVSNELYCKE
jgi:hypothetical protein